MWSWSALTAVEISMEFVPAHCANTNNGSHLSGQSSTVFSVTCLTNTCTWMASCILYLFGIHRKHPSFHLFFHLHLYVFLNRELFYLTPWQQAQHLENCMLGWLFEGKLKLHSILYQTGGIISLTCGWLEMRVNIVRSFAPVVSTWICTYIQQSKR